MKIIAKICSLITIISIVLILCTFMYGDETITSSLVASLVISSPLILLYFCIVFFEYHWRTLKDSIFYYIALGSFLGCSIFHIWFNTLMLIDVLHKGSLGPAQGYWLLILVFGSYKPIAAGCLFGAITYLWFNRKSS